MNGNVSQDDLGWFPAYPARWLLSKSVRRMTMTQRGIYNEMLHHAWRDGGVSADLDELACTLGMPLDDLMTAWPRISGLWVPSETDATLLVNPWMETIRAEQIAKFTKRSMAGKVAVAAREAKRASIRSSNGSSNDLPVDIQGEGEGEKKEKGGDATEDQADDATEDQADFVTEGQAEPRGPKAQAKLLYSLLPSNFQTVPMAEALIDYLEMRSAQKIKAWADKTIRIRAASFAEHQPEAVISALRSSAANGYAGVFPEKHGNALKVITGGAITTAEDLQQRKQALQNG